MLLNRPVLPNTVQYPFFVGAAATETAEPLKLARDVPLTAISIAAHSISIAQLFSIVDSNKVFSFLDAHTDLKEQIIDARSVISNLFPLAICKLSIDEELHIHPKLMLTIVVNLDADIAFEQFQAFKVQWLKPRFEQLKYLLFVNVEFDGF